MYYSKERLQENKETIKERMVHLKEIRKSIKENVGNEIVVNSLKKEEEILKGYLRTNSIDYGKYFRGLRYQDKKENDIEIKIAENKAPAIPFIKAFVESFNLKLAEKKSQENYYPKVRGILEKISIKFDTEDQAVIIHNGYRLASVTALGRKEVSSGSYRYTKSYEYGAYIHYNGGDEFHETPWDSKDKVSGHRRSILKNPTAKSVDKFIDRAFSKIEYILNKEESKLNKLQNNENLKNFVSEVNFDKKYKICKDTYCYYRDFNGKNRKYKDKFELTGDISKLGFFANIIDYETSSKESLLQISVRGSVEKVRRVLELLEKELGNGTDDSK